MIPGGVSFPGTPYSRRRLRCALLPGFLAFCWAFPVGVGSFVSGCCWAVVGLFSCVVRGCSGLLSGFDLSFSGLGRVPPEGDSRPASPGKEVA